jgi:mannose-6-phosphate isomerase-like protein (cupin superfamily)
MKPLLLLLALPLIAADPPGFNMWTGAELKTAVNSVKEDDHKVGVDKLATWDNHALWVIKREGDGEAEVHDTQVDIIFVTSGEGTLVIGGTVVEPRTTAPGETRGKSIKGGVSKKMAPGDVFHIPVKVPHQMLVPKLLTFEVVKVDTK